MNTKTPKPADTAAPDTTARAPAKADNPVAAAAPAVPPIGGSFRIRKDGTIEGTDKASAKRLAEHQAGAAAPPPATEEDPS